MRARSPAVHDVIAAIAVVSAAAIAQSAAAGGVVFGLDHDNGIFTPFNSDNADVVTYGDSGWFGTGASDPTTLREMTMGLATFGGSRDGTTDIVLTLNDGDPSGLVFGTGAVLYQTTIKGVVLPADPGRAGALFGMAISLPDIVTTGGFNNIGWSVRLQNFDYDGEFGFKAGSTLAQYAGFYTNNASFHNGTSWSLFSFGPDPTFGVANFVVSFSTLPAPGATALLALALAVGTRRRR